MALKIVHKNYWRTGTAGTPSSQHPQFPLTDSQIDTRLQLWRTTSCAGAEHTGWLDAGAAVEVDYLALLGHNLTSAATITLYGADDDSGTNQETAVIAWAIGDIFKVLTASITKRYWKLGISDTTNPAGYLEIATIILGKAWTPNRAHGAGYTDGKEDFSTLTMSDSLVSHGQEKPRVRAWQLPFTGLDATAIAEVQTLMDECGIVHGFIICFDSTSPATNTYFVKNTGLAPPSCSHVGYWNWGLAIREVV